MESAKVLQAEDYTVGWICALLPEYTAAYRMLDTIHEPPPKHNKSDKNVYTYGDINGHNVVILSLALGEPGKVAAQRAIQPLNQSFPNMNIHLFVGIGGGIPRNPSETRSEEDIHLGDVVIGKPERPGIPAIVEYDRGRKHGDSYELMEHLNKPRLEAVAALLPILGEHIIGVSKYSEHLQRITEKSGFEHPGLNKDVLFAAECVHKGQRETPCTVDPQCSGQVERLKRKSEKPVIHQGTILSGDTVMKDALERDRLSQKHFGAICIEMEAAGIMDDLRPLVIRGISDYADTHKNSLWQWYAAATAAAFAREILYRIQPIGLDMRHISNGRAALESNKSRLCKVDHAYILLERRDENSMKEDLESARQSLLQVRADMSQPAILDSSLLLRVNWGLMIAGKELSCCTDLGGQEKIMHIKEAERYSVEVADAVSRSSNVGARVQVTLEQYIFRGMRALLEFQEGANMDNVGGLKKDAVKGINGALKELKKIDPVKFNENAELASYWRERFIKASF